MGYIIMAITSLIAVFMISIFCHFTIVLLLFGMVYRVLLYLMIYHASSVSL